MILSSDFDFHERVVSSGKTMSSDAVQILQVNVGKLCNQACKHCHVDAGPKRPEVMTRETADHVLAAVDKFQIPTVDITGGAPELNPNFRYLVTQSRRLGAHVLVRHNLTVMFEPGQLDLPEFFCANDVEVISSLPYFLERQTDAQRGTGVFDKSISALKRLNAVGYGLDGSNRSLNLVTNPVGAFLPAEQPAMEADFKRELKARHGIRFHHLYTITNMPINRFLDYLRRSGNEERYMRKLVESFNPATVNGLMCKTMVSVGWLGDLYDCDFNQMLELGVAQGLPRTIRDFDPALFARRPINTGAHCFGCTAGSGSSCGGAISTD